MQTRWPTHTTIFFPVRFSAGSQLPITNANILRLKKKTFLGNFVTGEQDLEKKFFWQWELKQLLSSL